MCELGCVRAEVHMGSGIGPEGSSLGLVPAWLVDDKGRRGCCLGRVGSERPTLSPSSCLPSSPWPPRSDAPRLRPCRSWPSTPDPIKPSLTRTSSSNGPPGTDAPFSLHSLCGSSSWSGSGSRYPPGTGPSRSGGIVFVSLSSGGIVVVTPDQAHKIATFDRERRGFLPGEGWQ
jgi:hypothetical protein